MPKSKNLANSMPKSKKYHECSAKIVKIVGTLLAVLSSRGVNRISLNLKRLKKFGTVYAYHA
jgi:hypothetical protein